MGTATLEVDIAIIGGGIAGLWALNQLRNAGYSAVLFEQEALGDVQTIGAQGIIHGGIKYTLAGALDKSSETIAAMPGVWRDCLAGRGKVDLRACLVNSDAFYLWSQGALPSRLSAFFTSKLLRGRVQKLSPEHFPPALQSGDCQVQVYRLEDFVLDMPSLLRALAGQAAGAFFKVDWKQTQLTLDGGSVSLRLPHCTVTPQKLLLTAGAGNAALIARLGGEKPLMQRRPLQQVLVKHQYPQPLFGHCLGNNPSPRLTITSHCTTTGEPVWYLGGDLATAGIDQTPQELIDTAQRELATLLPWIDLGQTEWRTVTLDRAEPRQSSLLRPDSAFVGEVPGCNNVLAAWPTKLSLAPHLGDALQQYLERANIVPRYQPDLDNLAELGRPEIATPYWDRLFK